MSDNTRIWTAAVARLGERSTDGRVIESLAARFIEAGQITTDMQLAGAAPLPMLRWMSPVTGGMLNPFAFVDIGVVTALKVSSTGVVWIGGLMVPARLVERDPDAWVAAQSLEGVPVSIGTRGGENVYSGSSLVHRDIRLSEAVLRTESSVPPWPGLDGLSVNRDDWHWVAQP